MLQPASRRLCRSASDTNRGAIGSSRRCKCAALLEICAISRCDHGVGTYSPSRMASHQTPALSSALSRSDEYE